MDLQLADEVAVVIGAASGLGRAIAVELAREGVRLALVDIASTVESLAAEIQRDLRRPARAFLADVTDYPAVQQIAAAVIAEFGRCDHVFVPAGIGSGKYGFPFWTLEPGDWDRVLRVNILGPVHAAHAFAPPMLAARRGTFLFFTSIAGQIGSQTDPPYSAAKAAVINFTQCAAKDLAPYNVRVNAISPGMIRTPLNRSVWQAWHDRQPEDQRQSYEEWAGEKARRVAPLGRWQTPEDIAAVAVFLASRRAENITGQTINVDGGQVMHA
ncbi:MAG: SDR family oxidoreductase [Candidatus Anammoximicrobium sp.]|nr:SDR family oxidoreductase [Candidatus Anammoximicrobium sp.]